MASLYYKEQSISSTSWPKLIALSMEKEVSQGPSFPKKTFVLTIWHEGFSHTHRPITVQEVDQSNNRLRLDAMQQQQDLCYDLAKAVKP